MTGTRQGNKLRKVPRYLPTQEEITEKRKEIQKEWSEETREKRYVGPQVIHWNPPTIPDPDFDED